MLRDCRRLLLLALILSGCTTHTVYEAPVNSVDDHWQHASLLQKGEQSPDAGEWWKQFADPMLDELIEQAHLHNLHMAIAMANIEQAKASKRLAQAGYQPTISANVNSSRNRYSRQTGVGLNRGVRNSFNASLEASWEPDFFGRTSHSVDAAEAGIGAAQASQKAVALTVLADVASNYFEIRGLQKQIQATKEEIQLLTGLEEIAQAQYESGIITHLDLYA